MAGLTLITGPAGSGKTARLLEAALAHYATDAFAPLLVLVPTMRHADQFRRRLVHGGRVAFGLEVLTLGQFARGVLARRQAPAATAEVAVELLQRVTSERIRAGGAARFTRIAHTPGLHRLVGQAVGDLLAEGVTPDVFADAAARSGSEDLVALADIYHAYLEVLATRGWHDPRTSFAQAAEALGGVALPTLVLVDGVQFLRTGEVALVAALAERTDVLLSLDPTSAARGGWTAEALAARMPEMRTETLAARRSVATFEAASAADDEAQLREIARSIKARLASDSSLRPSDFAVTFRQVTPHLALARRVFAEFELPLDPAAGERLADRPFGVWLRRLLRLGSHDWRTAHLADLLRSAFLDGRRWGVEGDTPDLLARVARGAMLWSSRENLDALADTLETRAVETASEAYAGRLRAARQVLRAMLPDLDAWLGGPPRTPGEHAAALDAALFGERGIARASVEGYVGLEADIRSLRGALNGLRAVGEQIGEEPVPFDHFVDALEDRMQQPTTLLREAGGVLLAPMHTLHGLRFRYLYAGGLAEGEFPAPRGAASFLDRRNRERLAAAGLALPPEARATEDELWRTVASRAETLTSLWRPRLDGGGRPLAASYYAGTVDAPEREVRAEVPPEATASRPELAVALARRWRDGERRRPGGLEAWDVVRLAAQVEQDRRSPYRHAGRFEGVLAPAEMPRTLGADVQWSASRVESYRTCPFQFFGKYGLHLHEIEEEQESADAATRGTVIHDILRAALEPLVHERLSLDASTVERAVARMHEVAPAIWDAAPHDYGFGRVALWRYEQADALKQIESLIRREAAEWLPGLDRIADQETTFEVVLTEVDPPVRMFIGIDRLDLGPGLARIVDYKTGKAIPQKDVRQGDRVQLQWYAMGARLQYPGVERLIARYSYLKPKDRPWALDSGDPDDAEVVAAVADVVSEVRAQAGLGRFEVGPRVDTCPRYCAFLQVCRVNHSSRRKPWE